MTAAETVAVQKTIYQTVRADPRLNHVEVLGPAAHAIVLDNHNGSDYLDLVRAGITPYQDAQAVHSYAAAAESHHQAGQTTRTTCTPPSGTTTPSSSPKPGGPPAAPPGNPRTPRPTPPPTPPRRCSSWPACKIPTMRYETLDDSPMGGRDGFGLWSCTSTHRHLQVACQTRSRRRREPAPRPPSTPDPPTSPHLIQLKIVGDVQSRRHRQTQTGPQPPGSGSTADTPVQATVTDSQGTRTFQVTKNLTRVPLRRA